MRLFLSLICLVSILTGCGSDVSGTKSSNRNNGDSTTIDNLIDNNEYAKALENENVDSELKPQLEEAQKLYEYYESGKHKAYMGMYQINIEKIDNPHIKGSLNLLFNDSVDYLLKNGDKSAVATGFGVPHAKISDLNPDLQKKVTDLVIADKEKWYAIQKGTPSQENKPKPAIGMTSMEVKYDTSWGKPIDINKTTSANSVTEQWVYDGYKYLYFEDGVLTTIQE
ncbi:hypothetical protein [Guptibacillus hwajinpoensis]|uniref:hypothetical protein n=1 Tax=Guptibacillus hwajinpoensis TaxID=208199 RepID=UPI003735250F